MSELPDEIKFRSNAIKAENIYHDVLWMQKPVVIYLIGIAIIGSFGNLSIIFLTIRTRNLRQACNFLLACLCASGFSHQLGIYTMFYIIFSEITYIPLKTCFYWQVIPLIGNMCGELLPFLIGIDRLICLFFPVLHRKINRRNYCIVNAIICGTYAFIMIYNAYLFANSHPNEAVNCGVIEALAGSISYTHFLSCASINIAAVFCYLIVWTGLRNNKSIRENNRQIFKCMALIMATLFAGWFSVSAARIILISVFEAGPIKMFYMKLCGVTIINTTCSSQAFILIWFSKDYRQALTNMFRCKKERSVNTTTHYVKSTIPQKSFVSY